ncbi:HAD hydrolase-like protein [Schaalia turicensis]|uniref:HAD hydrolase-like protein n=1 Tax=Schaalia turicensis TaxID=131111 RepID=UPI003689FDE4
MNPILIDLDGTFHDSAAIVKETFRATLREEMGEDHPEEFFVQFIGPPLIDTFTKLGAADPVEMVRRYRVRYEQRMLDTPIFPGMRELVEELDAAGVPLAIATSKNEKNARAILEHQGVAQHFRYIAGDPEDIPGYGKAEVVGAALRELRAQGIDTSRALMVGDRIHDVDGAGQHGLPTVLVEWGTAPRSEWELAWRHVGTARELVEILWDFAGVQRSHSH